jgi:hypothetical protein
MNRIGLAMFLGLLAFHSGNALAQDGGTAPAAPAPASDPAAEALKEKVEKLTQEVAYQTKQNEMLAAKTGAIADGVAPKGELKATSVIEGQILAYGAVDAIAESIAAGIETLVVPAAQACKCIAPPTKIALFSPTELKMISDARAMSAQIALLEDLEQQQKFPAKPSGACTGPKPKALAAGPLTAVGAALQAFSLFRVDREVVATAVTLEDYAVAASVASKLLHKNFDVVYMPSVYDLTAGGAIPQFDFYNRLIATREKVKSAIKDVENGITESASATTPTCKAAWKDWRNVADPYMEDRTALLALANEGLTSLTAKDDVSGMSRIQAYQRASLLQQKTTGAWLLQLKPVNAAGNVHISKNILFSNLSFSGGAIVSYMLFMPDGTLKQAATVNSLGKAGSTGAVQSADYKVNGGWQP